MSSVNFRLSNSLLISLPLLPPLGAESLSVEQREVLLWLFRPTLQTEQLSDTPYLTEGEGGTLVEIGPRYTHTHSDTHTQIDLKCSNQPHY